MNASVSIKTILSAIVLTAVFMVGWELNWRSQEYPATPDDDKYLWAHKRDKLDDLDKNDVVIIVGSFISANTKRLTSIARELNPSTYQVECAADIKDEWFEGATKVGVSAGASTPDWLIEEVVDRLKTVAIAA